METALTLHLAAKREFDLIDAALQDFVRQHLAFSMGGVAAVFRQRFVFKDALRRQELEPELQELLRKRHAAAIAFQNSMKIL